MWKDLKDRKWKQHMVRTGKILSEIRLPVAGTYKTRMGRELDPADQVRPEGSRKEIIGN